MTRGRIAVTGIGLISPLGHDIEQVFRRLVDGESAIGPLEGFEGPDAVYPWGAQISAPPSAGLPGPGIKFLDRYLRMTLASIVGAVEDAEIDREAERQREIGVVFAGWLPGMASCRDFINVYDEQGVNEVSPISYPNCAFNAAAAQAGIRLKFRAANATLSSGAQSGLTALEYACHQIRNGNAKQIVVSATQELEPLTLAGYAAGDQLVAPELDARACCAPFDRVRRGCVLGEASCSLVLEDLSHARARNAAIKAEVLGVSSGFVPEACQILQRRTPELAPSFERILGAALDRAGLSGEEVDYVCASAKGSRVGDAIEARALASLLGRDASVGSVKAALGELVGASPLVQISVAIQAMRQGVVPPTLNFTETDPECPLPGIASEPQRRPIRAGLVPALCWSGAAGGAVIQQEASN